MSGVGLIEKPDIRVGKSRRIQRCGRGQQTFCPGPACYTRFRAPVGPVVLLGELVQEGGDLVRGRMRKPVFNMS